MKNRNTKMRMTHEAFFALVDFIGSNPAEMGGAGFGYEDDMVIREFIPDVHAKTTRGTYTINTDYLNPIIKKMWEEKGYSLIMIAHSHPHGYSKLSRPDQEYFEDMLTTSIKRDSFFAPVVFTIPDGGFNIFPHILNSKGKWIGTGSLEVVNDSETELSKPVKKVDVNKDEVAIATLSNTTADWIGYMQKAMTILWFTYKVFLMVLSAIILVQVTSPLISFLIGLLK